MALIAGPDVVSKFVLERQFYAFGCRLGTNSGLEP
jgi:hypothetical protein